MSPRRISVRRQLWAASALACTLATVTPAVLAAQMGGMGGGGMGGGGMGGRSGGMGGGGMGGRGGPGMGGGMKSPAAMTKERIQQADPVEFLLDRKKPLELTKEQQDAFKSLRKEMQHMQAPLFKELDKLFGGMPPRGGRGGGSPPAGGMGGGAPDTVRVVVGRLSDIQDSFRDRAREQLTALQRTRADSLQQVILAEERAKSEKEREKRQPRR